jgi:hypothetical protein
LPLQECTQVEAKPKAKHTHTAQCHAMQFLSVKV